MKSVWQSLAWKEWHEHKWKLVSMSAIIVGVSIVPIISYDQHSFGAAAALATYCIAPLAMFIGASAVTGERTRGTMAFTESLPVERWQVALSKLTFGWLTCIVPLLLDLALLWFVFLAYRYFRIGPSPQLTAPIGGSLDTVSPKHWVLINGVSGTALATSVFLWTGVIGARRKDEISASAWALLALVVWWVAVVIVPLNAGWSVSVENTVLPLALAASPGGCAFLAGVPNSENSLWWPIAIAVAVQIGLAAAFVRRYGDAAHREVASPQTAVADHWIPNWLGPPRSSPSSALVWKQCRESGPIVLTGLAGIIGTTVLLSAIEPRMTDSSQAIGEFLAGVSAYFGVVVTVVLGIGIFLKDLTPGLHTFWRSRPISPDVWFWIKVVTGLAVLVAAFSVPFGLVMILSGLADLDVAESAPLIILVPFWIYSATILMTCLVRHALYACVLSWAAMYLNILAVVGVVRLTKWATGQIPWKELRDPTTAEMSATMIVGTITFAMLAWLAVRYDWGRKSRY
jgi:ABC-type transport system involved in multi-copper enzyme maturation permease subunit